MSRTITDKFICLMISSGIHKPFWSEAVNTTIYLINRSPSTAINFKIPMEIFFGSPPNFSYLRIFGCAAIAYQREGKLDLRCKKSVFLSYPNSAKRYRLINEPWVRVVISKHVIFNEFEMSCLKIDSNPIYTIDLPLVRDVSIEV